MGTTESFEFLNELALAFRAAENHPRPQCTPVLEGVRAVLAHLQSAGRLLADDEQRLTAELVEDVEALVATANPYSAPAARLRALFPATEPAEDAKPCGSNSVTLGWCKLTARHEGLHTNGTYLWGTPSEPDPPAPSEPAEERCQSVSIFRERCALVPGHDGRHAANGCAWGYPPTPAEPAEDIRGLIEKSSLGTESAQALISTVSPEHGRRVAQEAARREAGTKVKLTELQRDLLQRIVDQWTKGAGWTHVFWSGTVEALISASCIVRHEEAFNEYRPTIFGEKALAAAEPAEAHCTVPPEGWWCSRAANHDGPCAASEGVAPWVPQPLEADWLDQVDPRDPQSRTHRETAAAKFAEPAEEETKAEVFDLNALVRQLAQAGWRERERCESIAGEPCIEWDTQLDWQQQIEYQVVRGILAELKRLELLTLPASSPVVPAPTETGPWQRIEDVPEGVMVRGTDGTWRGDPDGWLRSDGARASANLCAPFVAAEEG